MTLSSGPVHGGLLSIFYLCDNVLSSPISMKMKITGDTNIHKKLIFAMPSIKDILKSEDIFEVQINKISGFPYNNSKKVFYTKGSSFR